MVNKSSVIDKKTRMNDALNIVQGGPLYLDKSKLDPNYMYKFVSDSPGSIEHEKRLGYFFVNEDLTVGDQRASDASGIGSTTQVKSKCGQTLYLMAIHLDDYTLLQEVISDRNKRVEESLGHIEGIKPADMITGNVSIGTKHIG